MIFQKKSQPAPSCLDKEKQKAAGDYKCGDVLERTKEDFKNKCYICENKEPITINIEHFRPHKGNKELKFDWNNLFWSCSHCNNIKSSKYTDIIDCTNLTEDIENRIRLYMRPFPKETVDVIPLDESSSTNSTVKLLDAVYNGTTQLKRIEAANLRNKILVEIRDFQQHLCNYYQNGFVAEDKMIFLAHIKRHLSRSSNFTQFKRWIVKENEVMKKDFEQYFD